MKSITSKIRLAIFGAAAATVLFGGCDKGSDNVVDNTPVPVSLISTIDEMPARATGTAWAVEDAVGITMSSIAGVAIYMNGSFNTAIGEAKVEKNESENYSSNVDYHAARLPCRFHLSGWKENWSVPCGFRE